MRLIILTLLFLSSFKSVVAAADIDRMRELFELVDKDEKYYIELDKLTKHTTYRQPIPFGYRALYYFMRAKYLYWPNQKLAAFNTGKKIMEAIITLNPNEPELRLIRYSVQYNLPSVLSYNQNVTDDKKILQLALKDKKYNNIHYLINGVLTLYP
ncbi:MAG: hypothetical protein R3279_09100 [Putridiphycobacter sp.]|nr:hypothetical protein [Putridiphycobacter sp.]